MKTTTRAFLLVFGLLLCLQPKMNAQTGTSCPFPAPAYINVLATYNTAKLIWPLVPQIEAYHLIIRDITYATNVTTVLDIPEYFGGMYQSSTTGNAPLQQNHKYKAVLRSVCGNFTDSNDSITVVFDLIVIEDIVYGASSDCGLTDCNCTLNSTWWNNKLVQKNKTVSRSWLTTPKRQVIQMTVADSAVATNYAKFKIAKDNCDNHIEILSCESNPYTIAIVGGDNYLRVKSGATSLAYVYLESDKYKVKALTQAFKVTVKLCDTCTVCTAESILGNPNTDEVAFNIAVDPNTSKEADTATANNFVVGPNPIVDHAKIAWELSEAQPITLVLSDMTGREIMRFFDREILEAGDYAFDWQAAQLPTGLYQLILTTQSGVQSKQLLKL